MSNYMERLAEHRRLIVLKFLSESPEYTSNASILEGVCNDFGVTSTRDQVLSELTWLHETGLVRRDDKGSIVVVTATVRGVDVASGKARHDGVQRPRPSA